MAGSHGRYPKSLQRINASGHHPREKPDFGERRDFCKKWTLDITYANTNYKFVKETFIDINPKPEKVVNEDKWKEYGEKLKEFLNRDFEYVEWNMGNPTLFPCSRPLTTMIKEKKGLKDPSVNLQIYVDKNEYYKNKVKELYQLRQESFGIEVRPSQRIPITDKEVYYNRIIELFSEGCSRVNVKRKIYDEYKVVLGDHTVDKIFKDNKDRIIAIRDTNYTNYDNINIHIKKTRLEKLNYILDDLMDLYDRSNLGSKLSISKEIKGILEQARKEVEGNELKLTINGRIDIEQTITQIMHNSPAIQDLTIMQLTLSRVCSRLGKSYFKLMYQLSNSFYSKYMTLPQNEIIKQISYPSDSEYDILDIKSQYDEILGKEDAIDVKFTDIIEAGKEKNKMDDIRNILKQKLLSSKI